MTSLSETRLNSFTHSDRSFMERVGRKPVFKFAIATGLPYLGKRSGQLNVRLKTAICDGRVRDFL